MTMISTTFFFHGADFERLIHVTDEININDGYFLT
jgi:hypothetical protein